MSDSVENLLYVERTKGYKMKIFTTEITDVIRHIAVCSVCEGIMRNPCVVTKGGVGTTCLSCKRIRVEHLLTDNIKSGIAILEVKCPLEERGCAWVGKLSGIEGHMESCGEFKLECPQKCNFVTKRSEMGDHTKNHCPMRVVECEHCKEKMCYKELGIHFTICPEYPLKCVCGERHRRKNIEIHERDKCLETVIECEHKGYGCNDRFKRKFKEEHGKENQAKHIDLKFQTLEKALGNLENQNNVLTAKVEQLDKEKCELQKENQMFRNKVQQLEVTVRDSDIKNNQLTTEVQQMEDNNRKMGTKLQELTGEVSMLDDLSMWALVVNLEIEVLRVTNAFSDGPTFVIPKGDIKAYTKYRWDNCTGALELVVAVWPISSRLAFSHQFWTLIVKENNALSRKYNYKSNREITEASSSRPFEASIVIARIPKAVASMCAPLRVKVFIK